jgi:rSAM/selenodomain-associated transferase 1
VDLNASCNHDAIDEFFSIMQLEILRAGTTNPSIINRCALGIMIKAPRAGFSKTRLSPPLTPEEAAGISRCFLLDTTAAIAALTQTNPWISGVGIYTPVGSESEFNELLPGEFKMIAQRSEGFGGRLFGAMEDLFSVGYETVCLIDSDSPTLPPGCFEQLVNALHESKDQLVLGPCVDGGYYAVGLRRPHRRIFEEITWSTDQVYRETLERAAESDLTVVTLPAWYDVDDQTSLQRLLADLFQPLPAEDVSLRAGSAPETEAFLQRILDREGSQRIWPDRRGISKRKIREV